MIVKLTPQELFLGATQGIMRACTAIGKGRIDTDDERPEHEVDRWMIDIEGALGEMAAAKGLGVYWSGVSKFRGEDAGRYEVKTTRWEKGRLLLPRGADDDKPYVLAVGQLGTYDLVGWAFGRDVKQPQYWSEMKRGSGRCGFMMPQDHLRPMEDLG